MARLRKKKTRPPVNPDGVNIIFRYPDKANWERFEALCLEMNASKNAMLTVILNSYLRSEGVYEDPLGDD